MGDFLAKFGVTIFFGVLSTVLAITFYLKNKKIKQISYEMLSSTAILNKINNKVKVYFEEKEVKNNLYALTINIANTGNQPIKKEDFDNELKLVFSRTGENLHTPFIFEANVNFKAPEDLEVEFINNVLDSDEDALFDVDKSKSKTQIKRLKAHSDHSDEDNKQQQILTIKPMLLNPKDHFTLSLLVTEFEEFKLSARIVGGDVIKIEEPVKRKITLLIGNQTVNIPLHHIILLILTFGSFVITLLLQMEVIG